MKMTMLKWKMAWFELNKKELRDWNISKLMFNEKKRLNKEKTIKLWNTKVKLNGFNRYRGFIINCNFKKWI